MRLMRYFCIEVYAVFSTPFHNDRKTSVVDNVQISCDYISCDYSSVLTRKSF